MGCKYVKEFEFPSSGKVSVRGYQRGGPVKKAGGGIVNAPAAAAQGLAQASARPSGPPVVPSASVPAAAANGMAQRAAMIARAKGGRVKKADGGAVKIDVDMSKPAKAVPVPKGKPVVGPSRAQFDKSLAVRKDANDKTANFGKTPAERRQLIGGEGVYKARGGKVCAPKFK